jgi:hypothetical protein
VVKRASVVVAQTITIEIDESKFDDQFMEEFRQSFFPFFDIDDHIEHIAQLQARGVIDLEFNKTEFIEGYGPAHEMGIRYVSTDLEVESISYAPA